MKGQLNLKLGLTCVACALALAGCGGSSEDTTAATPSTPSTAAGTASLTYATYSATPYSGGAATTFTVTSISIEDSGLPTKTNRVTVMGSGGGFERQLKIYVEDSNCTIINIAHAWAPTAADLLGPTAVSTFVSSPTIGTALGLEPATNTITFNDTLLDGNAPDVSTLKGTVKPSTKVCASAAV